MPEIEAILLVLAVVAALLGGMFSKLSPGVVALLVAVTYFAVAFFVFDRSDSLWLVSLFMGFCMAGVAAMAGSYAGRALSKLQPKRD